jgi:phosphate/sulfate permease
VTEDGPLPREVRAAAIVIALESLALLVAAVILLIKTVAGHPHSVAGALLGAALAVGGAVVLAVAGRGLLRLQPAARTPIVVLQLLALPVAYSLAFQAHRVEYGGPILVAALAVLYLLFTPPARLALDRAPRD